jgi:predicted Zn-dependent peptidase
MIRFLFALVVVLLPALGRAEPPTASAETSPGGIAYTLLHLPGNKDVAVTAAWPTDWAYRAGVNQAAPIVGTHLILSGGADGYPAGEVIETFADLKAEARLYLSAQDHVIGEIVTRKENLSEAARIANAHLRAPTLDEGWFARIRDGVEQNMAAARARPSHAGFAAVRWAVFGDQPLRNSLSLDAPGVFRDLSRADVAAWHRETFTRNPEAVVVAGDIDAAAAGRAVDALLAGLPDTTPDISRRVRADFTPRRILLHLPDAKATSLAFIAPLPPTQEGGELEDLILTGALGGQRGVLFDAVRTRLRASYGFSAGFSNYTRELRVLFMAGEVEPDRLTEIERTVHAAYAGFRKDGPEGKLAARKAPLRARFAKMPDFVLDVTRSELQSALDGHAPGRALGLAAEVDSVTQESLRARLVGAYPETDDFIVIAVSPDANALPDACVITVPQQASGCR